MPAAVRYQPYPFAGITQVRFLRSPQPVGASQPGLLPALEGGERPELPLSYSVQGKGSTGGRGRQSRPAADLRRVAPGAFTKSQPDSGEQTVDGLRDGAYP